VTETSKARIAGLLALVFFLPLALAGGAAALRAAGTLRAARAAAGWRGVPGRIEHLASVPGGFEVSYAYRASGRTYRGERIGPEDCRPLVGRLEASRWGELERARAAGGAVTVWVNPVDPGRAVLFREPRWDDLTLLAILACVFGGVGTAGSVLALLSTAQAVRAARVPDWKRTMRAESRERVVFPSPWIPLFGSWCWALVSCGVGGPLCWYVVKTGWAPGNRFFLLVFVLPLLGAVLLVRACRTTAAAWRWRRVRFRLKGEPRLADGWLRGVVEVPGRRIAGASVSLACLETITTVERSPDEEGGGREREFDETRVLWRSTREAEPLPAPAGTEIAFAFPVPASCPETSREIRRLGPRTHSTVLWHLAVRLEGPDAGGAEVGITVPVFSSAEGGLGSSGVPRRPPWDPPRPWAGEGEVLRRAGISVDTESEALLAISVDQGIGRRAARLGRLRVLKAGLAAVLLTGLYTALVAGFFAAEDVVPTGLFVVLLCMGTILLGALWFSVAATVLYAGEQILVDATHLTVRQRFAVHTRVVRIPLRDIESVCVERCPEMAREAGRCIRLVYGHPGGRAPLLERVLSGIADERAAGIVARKLLHRLRPDEAG